MDWSSLATIMGAVFGSQALVSLTQGFFAKKKTDADAASTLVQSMLDWQKTLTDRIVALEMTVHAKDKQIDELRERISLLENEMSRMESTQIGSNS